MSRHDPLYRQAQRAARAREFAIERANARAISRALDAFALRIARQMASLSGPRREQSEASVAVIRLAAAELDQAIAQATREGRDLAYSDVLDIWDVAGQRAVRSAVPNASLGAIARPAVSMAGVFDAVGSPNTWRTLLREHVQNAAQEAGTIVREALLAGEAPEAVARKLRRYVEGSEALDELFEDERIDLRRVPRELRGAARQVKFNSERIAFTELHNARFEAETEHFARDVMVRAQQRVLAPDRGTLKAPDECDVLAMTDFYGLGPGVYPVAAMPPEPHPYGRCENVPVTSDSPVLRPPSPALRRVRYRIPREEQLTDAAKDRVREQVSRSLEFAESVRREVQRRAA